jgi:hypothetical protein
MSGLRIVGKFIVLRKNVSIYGLHIETVCAWNNRCHDDVENDYEK